MDRPLIKNADQPETRRTRVRRWLDAKTWFTWMDLALVVIMSVASLAAAWSGYQATNWNSEQSELYSMANTIRMQSVSVSNTADAQLTVEVLLFNAWAEAYVRNDTALMNFYRQRMLPEVQAALDAWIATDPLTNPDAPREPFAIDGFIIHTQATASDLEQQASLLVEAGQKASRNGNHYVFSTVLLALVLFFAGLATKFTWRPAQLFAASLSSVLLLAIITRMALYPIA